MPPTPLKPEPTSLARYLGRLTAAELADVLRATAHGGRPVLTLGELALRIEEPRNVTFLLRSLRQDHQEVIEAVLALGVAARADTLATLLGATASESEKAGHLADVLTDLRRLALVWPDLDDEGRYAVAEPLREAFPAPLGTAPGIGLVLTGYITSDDLGKAASRIGLRPGSRKDARIAGLRGFFGDLDQIRAVVAAAPAETRELLAKLAEGDPYVQYETDGYSWTDGKATRHVCAQTWARDRLVLTGSYHTTQHLVAEVALALRGPEYRAPFTAPPPPADTLPVAEDTVRGSMQAAFAHALQRCDTVLRALAAKPLAMLKAGGVGVREQRRLAAEVAAPEPGEARLWLEIAGAAGLAAFADGAFRVTDRFQDLWLGAEQSDRAALLLRSWLTLDATPLARTEDAAGRRYLLPPPTTAIAADVVARRRSVLDAFAAIPAGLGAVESGPVLAHARWLRAQPGAGATIDRDRADAVLAEAELLGVVVSGGLSPVGRALLDPHPAALTEALAGAMPAATTTAFFHADLTAMVTGAASASLAGLLDSAADREGTGGSVWRFSPPSVRRAMDGGATADSLLAALTEAARRPLPQALEYLVRDVGRRHGEASVLPASCLVVVREPRLLAELLGGRGRELAALGLRQVADTVAVCDAAPCEALGALRNAGYFPTGPADGPTVTVAPAGANAGAAAPANPAARSGIRPAASSSRPQAPSRAGGGAAPAAPAGPAGAAGAAKPTETMAPSRVHPSVCTPAEQAAVLVGTALESPERTGGSSWFDVIARLPHLPTEQSVRFAGALFTGACLNLVIIDDPSFPGGHTVEELVLTGARLIGWCLSHDTPFSAALDDIEAVLDDQEWDDVDL